MAKNKTTDLNFNHIHLSYRISETPHMFVFLETCFEIHVKLFIRFVDK
jgi:hypothetical protein